MSYPRGEEYQRRFDALAASGHDVHGEATLVRSYRPRSALDAGCGTGRVAIELATHGIEVLGVDVDPAMLATATQRAPDLQWRVGDLATVDLVPEHFDVAVLAGNVLIFVQPGTEADVLANVTRAVRVGGRVIAGFQLRNGGYDLDGLARDALAAGLVLEDRWSTWDRAPAALADDYAVSVFVRAPRPSGRRPGRARSRA